VFLTKSKDGDYHQEMNSVVFLEWFENQLMPALKNPSLVVLDNAEHVDMFQIFSALALT
jgi:transposase